MELKPTPQLPPVKKPYATPVLHVYGSVGALTNAVDMSGNLDNAGNAGMNRS